MQKSKPIDKTDESAKELIIETLGNNPTGGFDLDSVYYINGTYYIIEFLRCIGIKPFYSHPNRYWNLNKQKFISLWDITTKLNGQLYLINYEDSREQFKVIRVLDLDEKGIHNDIEVRWDFEEFKQWFQLLNNIEKRKIISPEINKDTTNFDDKIENTVSNVKTLIPWYSIYAACGNFTGGYSVGKLKDLPVENVKGSGKDLFIVEAIGKSMMPLIEEGHLCVFKRTDIAEEGDIVLVEESEYTTKDFGSYIIKKYTRNKNETKLISLNPKMQDKNVTFTEDNEDKYKIRGVFVGTISSKKIKYLRDL